MVSTMQKTHCSRYRQQSEAACSREPERVHRSRPLSILTGTRSIPAKGIVTTERKRREASRAVMERSQSEARANRAATFLLSHPTVDRRSRFNLSSKTFDLWSIALFSWSSWYAIPKSARESVENMCSHWLTSTPPRHLSAIPHRSLVTMSLKRRARMPVSRPSSVLSPSETS